eukprot:c1061_g1_i1 orf=125-2422(+)
MASSLMPPPPPMPPKAAAKPASAASGDLEDSGIGTETPSSIRDGVPSLSQATASDVGAETGGVDSAEVGEKTEKREGSLQVSQEKDKKKTEKSDEKDKRKNDAGIQTSFNSGIYSIPSWSAAPAFPFALEVIKDGALVDTLNVSSKGAYMFGRSDLCDFVTEHPSISRFHAVLQFKRTGDAFIYDLGSTHGTIVNKKQVPGKTYVPLRVGDLFKFGLSSRLYVLQGPSELMPKEGLTKAERQLLRVSETVFDVADQEASLLRAKREAMQMEGATWGMMEDAIEDEIQEEEELTWQTYKGQLTEKQQKTLDKIHKRNEKVASLKREIDAIQVKEIPQGGLTQGQQTQVARNQQRIEQLMEELDNLEETLNQSIQESTGARAKKGSSKMGFEDEEEDSSDDDDFYDRTSLSKKAKASIKGGEPSQIVETAESLLEKRAQIMQEMERLNELLTLEKKNPAEICEVPESEDPLDAFMTTVSSKLESDRASNLRQELEKQQADLNRIMFLLKVADPSGEALKNWENEPRSTKSHEVAFAGVTPAVQKISKKEFNLKVNQEENRETSAIENLKSKEVSTVPLQVDGQQDKGKQENMKGPLWLGHARKNLVETMVTDDNPQETSTDDQEFLEYKERHKSTPKAQDHGSSSEIPEDACGLILRKPKDGPKEITQEEDHDDEKKLWEGAALAAADTVALLLRHQKGLGAVVDEELQEETPQTTNEDVSSRSKKRKLGPERPEFLNKGEGKFQAWIPPAGQTGDGRTALNEKYGY